MYGFIVLLAGLIGLIFVWPPILFIYLLFIGMAMLDKR